MKARKVLENHWQDMDKIGLNNFPRGCCGNTSDILGQYLSDKGASNLMAVSGCRDGKSHAWLEFDGFILDITSDQFHDGCGNIFIGRESEFHASFKNQVKDKIRTSAFIHDAYIKFSELMRNT